MAGNLAGEAAASTHRPEEVRRSGRQAMPLGLPADQSHEGSAAGLKASGPGAAVSLREARTQLEQVCQMLVWPSPDILDNCENLLAATVRELDASRPSWPRAVGDSHAVVEARLARKTLQNVHRLLENAASFHVRWQRIKAAIGSGYQADGAPGQLRYAARRIFVEG